MIPSFRDKFICKNLTYHHAIIRGIFETLEMKVYSPIRTKPYKNINDLSIVVGMLLYGIICQMYVLIRTVLERKFLA